MNGASLDTIFDPFSSENDTENNNNTFSYDTFENIRLACEFHLPKDIQHVITNNQDKLNIMHVNARSILTFALVGGGHFGPPPVVFRG